MGGQYRPERENGISVGIRRFPTWFHSGFAILVTLTALGISIALDPILHEAGLYIPFLLAVVAAGRYAGRIAGWLALVLSAISIDLMFVSPRTMLLIGSFRDELALIEFLVGGGVLNLWLARSQLEPGAANAFSRDLSFLKAVRAKPHRIWLSAAVVLLLVEGALIFATWDEFSRREAWTRHTNEVIQQIDTVFSTLKDAETGERGFVLTGDENYLRPYNEAVATILPQLDQLARLDTGNSQHQARVRELRPLIAERLQLLRDGVDLMRVRGASAATTLIRTDRGRRVMDQIRHTFRRMREEELALLGQRSAQAVSAAHGMGLVMFSGAGMLLMVLLSGYRSIDRSVAEIQQAERSLRASDAKFRAVFQALAEGLVLQDLTGNVLESNEAAHSILGLNRSEHGELGAWIRNLVRYADKTSPPMEGSSSGVALHSGTSMHNREIGTSKPDGSKIWVSVNTQPVYGDHAELVGSVSSFFDISERKRSERAMQWHANLLRLSFDAILTWRPDGGIESWNLGAERLYGFREEEARGHSSHELLETEFPEPFPDVRSRLLSQGSWEGNLIHRTRNGRKVTVSALLQLIHDEDGREWVLEINRDITARIAAEQKIRENEGALRESEKRYRTLVEQAGDAIFVHDFEGKLVDVNERAVESTGYSREELLSLSVSDLEEDFDLARAQQTWANIQAGHPLTLYGRQKRKDGTIFPIEARLGFISVGEQQLYLGIFRDVSERERLEEALRQSERQYRTLFETMNEGLVLHEVVRDSEGRTCDLRYLAANPAYERQHGFHDGCYLGKTVREIYPQIDPNSFRTFDDVAFRGESTRFVRWFGVLKKWFDVSAFQTEYGRFGLLIGDVTDRKKAETELVKSERRFRGVFENALTGIATADSEGHLQQVNSAFRSLLGYSEQELDGRIFSTLIPEPERHATVAAVEAIRSGEIPSFQSETRYAHEDGHEVWVQEFVSPLEGSDGQEPGLIVLVTDITERRNAEEKVRQLNATLEEKVLERTAHLEAANQELESFSYSVSHDLRAPLRGIDGWSLALLEDYGPQLDSQAHKYLGRVRSEAQRMGVLIDDLLKLSRISRSLMETRPVNLSVVAGTVAERLSEANPDRHITFQIEDGLWANCDSTLLDVVLTNLMGNAVKFTGRRAEARIEFGKTRQNGENVFFVRDNGVGFEMAYAKMLFGAFQRLHKTSEFPGTGIGLATVQRVIRRHGGRVWADAKPDAGATFFFTLTGA